MDVWLTQMTMRALAAGAATIGLIAGLLQCFFGYVFFRFIVIVCGILAGVLAGQMVVWQFKASPATFDFVVVCISCAVVMALASFPFFRLVFCLLTMAGAFALAAQQGWCATQTGLLITSICILAGGVLLSFCFHPLVMIVSSYGGAVTAVYALAVMIVGPTDLSAGPWSLWWFRAGLLVAAIALGALGYVVQRKLAIAVTDSLKPPPRKGRRRGGNGVYPRLTRR